MLMWLATLVVLLIPVCKGAVEGFKVAYVVVWSSPLEFKLGRPKAGFCHYRRVLWFWKDGSSLVNKDFFEPCRPLITIVS
jgi:hypothetical protein